MNYGFPNQDIDAILNRLDIKSIRSFIFLGDQAMRKTFLLALLLFTLGHATSYAEDVAKQSAPPEFIKASVSNTIPDSHSTRDANTRDGWGTSITIYSLIIGIYALYWFRQKA